MKIAYIYPENIYQFQARNTTILNTCYFLSLKNHLTFISISTLNDIKKVEQEYQLDLKKIKILTIQSTFLSLFKSNKIFNFFLKKIIKNKDFDILYVRHLKTARELIKCKKKNQKIIFESHEIFYKTSTKKDIDKIKKLEKYVYQNVDGIVFISKTLKEDLKKDFDLKEKNLIVLPLGAKVFMKKEKDFSKADVFYYFGTLYEWKGIDFLIKAFKNIPANLKIYGSASEKRIKEIKTLIKELKLSNIEFYGKISHAEVLNLLINEAKFCILPNLPSVYERYTSPLKLFEYMATNNIVIASNIDSIQDIIKYNQVVISFESGSIKDLQLKIFELIKQPNKFKYIADNAFESIQNEYSWEIRTQKLINFFKDIKTK